MNSMTEQQTTTLKATIADLQARASEIEADLNFRVIDGTPFLLGITVTRPEIYPGSGTEDRLLYGTWDSEQGKVQGWKHEEAVPSHRCGLVHVSRESAEKNLVHLRAQGFVPFYIHYREFLTARLARTREVIAHLEFVLAKAKAGQALDAAAETKVKDASQVGNESWAQFVAKQKGGVK